MKLAPLTGSLLAGSVQGSLDVGWREEFSLEGTIRGRNLNPAGISPDWAGVVNFDLTGSGRVAEAGPAPGGGERESSGKPPARAGPDRRTPGGLCRAATSTSAAWLLQGKGFDINAAGDLGKRLAFDAQVGDLGRLIPRTAGELRADGWVRWHDGRLDGSLTGQGRNLAADGMRIAAANLTARLGEGKGYPLHVTATLRKAAYEEFQAESVTLEADGTALRHTVNAVLRSAGAEARIALSGAYSRGSWQGEIVRFSGRDRVGPWSLAAPAALAVAAGRVTLAPLVLTGAQPERIEIAGELTGEPLSGSIRAAWNGLNLARVNPWLTEVRVTGASAGNVQLRLAEASGLPSQGVSARRGTVTAEKYGDHRTAGFAQPRRGDQGMRAGLELHLAGGGVLKGALSSPAPARLAIPETVEVTAEWTGIDLALLRRWLPGDVSLDGRLAGRVAGKILSGERFDLTGQASLPRGKIRWQKGTRGARRRPPHGGARVGLAGGAPRLGCGDRRRTAGRGRAGRGVGRPDPGRAPHRRGAGIAQP